MTKLAVWTLLDIVRILRRHRGLLVLVPLAAGMLTGVVLLTFQRTWSTRVVLQPVGGGSNLGSLSGLAARLGIGIPGGAGRGNSPAFYVDVLRTRRVLDPVASAAYTVSVDGAPRTADLAEWFNVEHPDSAERLEATLDELRRRLGVGMDEVSGLVVFTVTSPWPDLSAAVADSILASLARFDEAQRRSQARAERTFLERRLAALGDELAAAETRWERFLEDNRRYQSDPRLRFRERRLADDASTLRQVRESLRQAFEEARMEEVRTGGDFTVVEPPHQPASPNRRYLIRRTGLTVLGTALILLVVILVRARARETAARG